VATDRTDETSASIRATSAIAGLIKWSLLSVAIVVLGGITLGFPLGYRVMVVTSGSMAPRFQAGDAVLVKKTGQVRVGDVVAFRALGGHGLTTHRVVGIHYLDGKAWIQTKGDANRTPDANLTPETSVYGRELLALPSMGRFLLWAVSPRGKLVLLGIPLLVLIGQEVAVLVALKRRRQWTSSQVEATPEIDREETDDSLTIITAELEAKVANREAEIEQLRRCLADTEAELEELARTIAAQAELVVPHDATSSFGRGKQVLVS
jgi:signal peptidase